METYLWTRKPRLISEVIRNQTRFTLAEVCAPQVHFHIICLRFVHALYVGMKTERFCCVHLVCILMLVLDTKFNVSIMYLIIL